MTGRRFTPAAVAVVGVVLLAGREADEGLESEPGAVDWGAHGDDDQPAEDGDQRPDSGGDWSVLLHGDDGQPTGEGYLSRSELDAPGGPCPPLEYVEFDHGRFVDSVPAGLPATCVAALEQWARESIGPFEESQL